MDTAAHWDAVFRTKTSEDMSWFQQEPTTSFSLIEKHAHDRSDRVIDVGAGSSLLVDILLASGFSQLTVLDISSSAVDVVKARLGDQAAQVKWIVGNVLNVELQPNAYSVWHDRAVFHFLTNVEDRTTYIHQASSTLRSGGKLILATFSTEGPSSCSGQEVCRYSVESLTHAVGKEFRLIESQLETHTTPWGTTQEFVVGVFQRN